jgi:hypothetical protein
MGFSDALKQDILDMAFLKKEVDTKDPWMRSLMQAYGTARRAVDPNHWIERLIYRLDGRNTARLVGGDYIVIDDLRFENEIVALEEWGKAAGNRVIVIRVEKTTEEPFSAADWNKVPLMKEDITETDLDDYPFIHKISVAEGELAELRNYVYLVLQPFLPATGLKRPKDNNGTTPSNDA